MNDSTTYSIDPSTWCSFELLQQVIDTIDDPIFAKDVQHRWIAGNAAFCAILGLSHNEVIGKSDPDIFPPDQAQVFWEGDDRVLLSGKPDFSEEQQTRPDGTVATIWTRKWPLFDANGAVGALCGTITDITAIRQRQERIDLLEREIADRAATIERQTALLDQIGVPVTHIWEGVLLLPLVGALDSHRAGLAMEVMLEAVSRSSAEVVILDITGVPLVDSSVASYVLKSVQAAQLLGCRSILVGISPDIAQTLVGLGIDFSQITTRATLQDGLGYALRLLNYRVTRAS